MDNNKKFKNANRISFILFSLYVLIFILLPIMERNAKYLIFLLLPIIFTISLVINVLIKKGRLGIDKLEKTTKKVSVLNMLLNGISLSNVALASHFNNLDYDVKREQIKKYPSIEPTWLFIIIFATIFLNFILYMCFFLVSDPHVNKLFIIANIISVIVLVIAQISSSFSMLYNNQKKDLVKAWKTILIVSIAFIIILVISYVITFI